MRFKPVVTRIKLNPEQAVLSCACWTNSRQMSAAGTRSSTRVCDPRAYRVNPRYASTAASSSVS